MFIDIKRNQKKQIEQKMEKVQKRGNFSLWLLASEVAASRIENI